MPGDSVAKGDDLAADALAVLRCWRGRPDATLHMMHDVCVPAGRETDRTMIPAVEECMNAGLVAMAWDGLVLTEAGREHLTEA